jgi:CheY-like chemotaxis protein
MNDGFACASLGDLGPCAQWPPALSVTLDILLHQPLPMLLMWGPQQVMLYNERYRSLAGIAAPAPGGRIPPMPPTAWSWNPAAIAQCWEGQSQHFPRQALDLRPAEQSPPQLFDLHYMPIRTSDGAIGGILCTLAPATPAPLPLGDGVSHTILVVEDNLDTQFLVAEMLRTLGHEVQAAASAEAALTLLADQRFDVLFSDVSLPGMSGLALGRAALQLQPALRVIFASGCSPSLTSELDYPALHIRKPYDIEQLQALLQAPAVAHHA